MKRAFINGQCHIFDEERTVAEAILVENGRIAKFGSSAEIKEAAPDAEFVDLNGRILLPGFNDSHMHFLNYGFYKTIVDLEKCKSKAEAMETIRAYIQKKNLPAGEWVEVIGWNNDNWSDSKKLTAEDLDQVSEEHPIYALRICGHVCILNRKARAEVGLTRALPQPKDGYYEVDADGEPTGLISEMMTFVYSNMKEPSIESIKEMLLRSCEDANRVGLTSVQTDDFDALPGRNFDSIIKAYRELIDEGKLSVRITEQCALANPERYDEFINAGYQIGQGDEWFKLGLVKLYLDGSLGARTAWLLDDYSDEAGTKGFSVYSDDSDLFRLVERAHLSGADVGMHCIGDAACDQGVRAIEAAVAKDPSFAHRHGLVHAQILNEDICRRMAQNHITAYIQPIFIEYDLHMAEDRIGKERIKTSYNWRDLHDLGIVLGMGTDCPVESFNPLPNIYSAVTRKDLDEKPEGGWYPQQALTLDEALEGYTRISAYLSRDEKIKGSLEVGMLADMVVLEENLYTCKPEHIKDIRVDMTIVNGEIKYSRN